MKESYGEGLATHSGPESCMGHRKVAREALTGESVGWVNELRNHSFRVPTLSKQVEGHTVHSVNSELSTDPAQSKTPCMCGHLLSGNRETLEWPLKIFLRDRRRGGW